MKPALRNLSDAALMAVPSRKEYEEQGQEQKDEQDPDQRDDSTP